jgi:hypothetical protein
MKRLLVAVLLAALAAGPAAQARSKLRRFHSCDALVDYGTGHSNGYQPGGPPPPFDPGPPPPAPAGAAGPGSEGAPTSAPQAPADDSGDFSLTNNQEAGVFEPDILKTDGNHIFAVTSAGVLEVVDVTGPPALLAELPLPAGYDHQLLLYKGKLLVALSTPEGKTILARVDVTDPAHPVIERTLTVNGSLLAERRTKGTVRVVLTVTPRAIGQPDQPVGAPVAWVPRGTFRNVRRETSARRTLVPCRAIRRPGSFTGLEELTVLTINLEKGLDPVDSDAVMTGGQTVYASAQNLFVATQQYSPQLEAATAGPAARGQTTQIHRFSLDDADNTTYRGSGSIPGFVLNQFSMSEQDGVLRVASTDLPPWFTQGNPSHSLVTTLSEQDDRLSTLGQLDGLGRGERIFAVRFLGDAGYVVTFRQVDPLFTVDVSDPAHPALRGELEMPGVSTYLHPIGGDRLLGLGSGTSDDGSQSGLQLSEFDVSDLAHPKLEHRVTVDGGNSEAQYDHHAFLWWAPRNLAVLPVSIYDYSSPPCDPGPCPAYAPATSGFSGAIGFTVTPQALGEAGRTSQEGVVRRSSIMGDRLLTMSDAGLKASSLDDYSDRGFAAFSAPPNGGGETKPGGGPGTVGSGGG